FRSLRGGQEADLDAPVDARLAHEVADVPEGFVRVLAVVTDDHEGNATSKQFVGARVLEVPTVRQVPAASAGAMEARESFGGQASLDRRKRGEPGEGAL